MDRYPTPTSAASLTAARLGAFLRRSSYSGKKPPEELLARLRQAPKPAGCLEESTLTGLVNAHVNQLRALLAILKELNHAIAVEVAAHPYAGLFAPMPRIGGLNLAQVVGEVGPILERAENAAQVAAEVGVAPVTHESGTRRSVVFGMAVNQLRPASHDGVRRQQPPRRCLGRQPLRRRAGPRQATPTRDPDPRPRLGPRDVAMLENEHALQPRQTHLKGVRSCRGERRSVLQRAPSCRRRPVCLPLLWLFDPQRTGWVVDLPSVLLGRRRARHPRRRHRARRAKRHGELSLDHARNTFAKIGASSAKWLAHVRPPLDDEHPLS